jgi:hypothetical protein
VEDLMVECKCAVAMQLCLLPYNFRPPVNPALYLDPKEMTDD